MMAEAMVRKMIKGSDSLSLIPPDMGEQKIEPE